MERLTLSLRPFDSQRAVVKDQTLFTRQSVVGVFHVLEVNCQAR